MSFLPFVISFLLIIVVGSSLLFQSFRSTAIERTVILSRNQAKLSLKSQQARKAFKALRGKTKVNSQDPNTQQQTSAKKDPKIKEYIQKRDLRRNEDSSKFNLWPLVYEPDSIASKILYKKAIKLIELLYGQTDFYKTSTKPKPATALIDAILGQKKATFSELFPKDPELSNLFYKMLKGTNTGYPRLEEYFKIEESKDKPPICFSRASTPVLKSILGEKITTQILEQEKKKWDKKPKERVLTKEELSQLVLKHRTEITELLNVEDVFSFTKPGKSMPKAFMNETNKIMYLD